MRFHRQSLAALFIFVCAVVGGGSSFYVWRAEAIQKTKSESNDSAQIRQPVKERGTKSIEDYQFYLRGRELRVVSGV